MMTTSMMINYTRPVEYTEKHQCDMCPGRTNERIKKECRMREEEKQKYISPLAILFAMPIDVHFLSIDFFRSTFRIIILARCVDFILD